MITFDDIFLLGYITQVKGLFFVAVTSTFLFFLLKSRYASLQQSIESSHLLMKSALDAVVSIDKHGKIMTWNALAESIFGYSQSEAIGFEVAELIIPSVYRNTHRTLNVSHSLASLTTHIKKTLLLFPLIRLNIDE